MEKILVINASARTQNSHSRKLTEIFLHHWTALHNKPVISYRELGNVAVPHINEAWISANFKPAADRTREERETLRISDAYIAELHHADIIVLGTPMYNWSIPSVLKAYIDQIMRLNETFRINPGNVNHPYTGLLQNKTLILLVARGSRGYGTGESNAHLNFQTTYLQTVFNMVGIHNIHLVAVNGTSLDKEELKTTIEQSHRHVRQLIEELN